MALLLQVAAWDVEVRDERVRGRGLERQLVERAGAGHGFLMSPYRSALGAEQIVPAVDLIRCGPSTSLTSSPIQIVRAVSGFSRIVAVSNSVSVMPWN